MYPTVEMQIIHISAPIMKLCADLRYKACSTISAKQELQNLETPHIVYKKFIIIKVLVGLSAHSFTFPHESKKWSFIF